MEGKRGLVRLSQEEKKDIVIGKSVESGGA